MSASLVGSEMCIRDRCCARAAGAAGPADGTGAGAGAAHPGAGAGAARAGCLLYTSDAADDM
eukprot:9840859-Alexandrium_andersonii.AAC.1